MTAPTLTELHPVPSAPGYWCGSDGSVWSLKSGRLRRLKPTPHKTGYLRVSVVVAGRQKSVCVHRLVAESWHGPCPPRLQVRHLDGNA
jgi:hypothetical protein